MTWGQDCWIPMGGWVPWSPTQLGEPMTSEQTNLPILIICGYLKICPKILRHFSLSKVEPHSSPLECGPDLATCFYCIECGRSSALTLEANT